jgi:formylglycine-generating enzyme required for sulfatase activity
MKMTDNKIIPLLVLFATLTACSGKSQQGDASAEGKLEESVPMVLVPAGKFIRGSNKVDDTGMQQQYGFPSPLYLDERPMQEIHVDAFYIDTYEVTYKKYKDFILKTKRMMPFTWVNNGYALTEAQLNEMDVGKLRKIALDYFRLDMDTRVMDKPGLIKAMLQYQQKRDRLPVGGINWFNAVAYCEWRSARLPTEAEWEKAARGTDGREFPWGNEWDEKITNTGDDSEWEDGIAPVGSFPQNKSPYGAYDMAGNVWEWVNDWYDVYPGSDYHVDAFGKANRVIRGGGGGIGHYAISYFFRASTRQFSEPEMESDDVGFRCAKDA